MSSAAAHLPRVPPSSLLALAPKDELRLRTYLDEQLGSLERDERKHRLGPLSRLLTRLPPVLDAILHLPAVEPWASTRVEYLLGLTANTIRYVTHLPLMSLPTEAQGEDWTEVEEEASGVMRRLLDLLGKFETGWLAVLKGQGWVDGHGVPVDGGVGVDQTARVRLRSIAENARPRLVAWARPYGEFGGEVMGPDGDEGEVVPEEEREGWEGEVVDIWSGLLKYLGEEVPIVEERVADDGDGKDCPHEELEL